MPWKIAKKIELSEKEEEILKEYKKGTHKGLHMKIRSEIVLRASQGESNNKIEREMKKDAKTIQKWRDRYSKSSEELKKILSDDQRPGGPRTYKEEEAAAIIALSVGCEKKI